MRRIRLALAILASLLPMESPAGPSVVGPPEVVFDWSRERCARWDIPDAPARAWRLPSGEVALLAGSEATRASRGTGLDLLERNCAVLHKGAHADDPGAYDDRSWLASTHAFDQRVEALAHVEFHGHLRPSLCRGAYAACWANAIVALESTDGGRSFARATPAFVAGLPYRYDGRAGRRIGYFNPSNILQLGDALHVFVFAESWKAQRRGVCLLQRPLDGDAGDWRAWDGSAFTIRFADPYREVIADPSRHVCTPLPGLTSTISSVVRHERTGRFLAVTPGELPGPDGVPRRGIWWTVSDDLVHWSRLELLHEVPLLWRRDCDAPAAFAYPSLIDDDSASGNFESVDDRFWLYLVEMHIDEVCRVGPRRDLIRMPVSWRGE
jgi:hypothetical protein